jgi:DNA repair protein SbcC/Rad50
MLSFSEDSKRFTLQLGELTVSNFRGFVSRQTMNLSSSVVLIYGRNGSGKTSIFDALELLLTGRVRRYPQKEAIGHLLVNAGVTDSPATLKLQIARGDESVESNVKIPFSAERADSHPLLTNRESLLFHHICYLQQAQLQRLVSSDSSTLGDVIRSLAIDENTAKLVAALGQASISRTQGNYQKVKESVDETERNLQDIDRQILALEEVSTGVEAVEIEAELHNRLTKLGDSVKRPLKKVLLSDPAKLGEWISAVDGSLQQDLKTALQARNAALHNIQALESFITEQEEFRSGQKALESSGLAVEAAAAALAKTRQRLAAIKNEYASSASVQTENATVSRLIRVLNEAKDLAVNDVCPICDRAFEDLQRHIDSKVARLTKRLTASERALAKLDTEAKQLQEVEHRQLRQLREAEEEPRRIKVRLDVLMERQSQFMKEMGGNKTLRQLLASAREDLAAAEASIRELTEGAETLSAVRNELSARTVRSRRTKEDLAFYRKRKITSQDRLVSVKAAQRQLETFIDSVLDTRRTLTEYVEGLLQQFVLVDTKDAFEELFRRIARNPVFGVTISAARMHYHHPEVSWRATYGNRSYPGEGVFSQGELNACGLAFFLALATTHQQNLGFLLLDDPVQNMDEVHIEEFGQVLKFLKDRFGWQLVIGVHEESVFSYLKRQLYPSREGQSLVSYVLEGGDERDGTRIERQELFEFSKDVFSPSEVA